MAGKEFLFEELKTLNKKVETTEGLPIDLKDRLNEMIERLERMANLGHYASEFDTLSRYIDTVASIPWTAETKDNLDLENAKQALEKNHYGMQYAKDRILEYLATLILLKKRGKEAISKSPILLLVGLQGVGKTTLAYSVAETLGRKFERIAMGGIGSTLELRGKSKAFPEAEPGQIVKALIKTGVKNPLILLDEIDKASGEQGLRMDIMAVLLEILDPKQNVAFRDHYIDYPVDLSNVLFICSANNTGTLSAALMDRMEIIKMPSYTDNEKLVIARDYLMPKILENSGLSLGELEIDPDLWPGIVRPFGYDSGIRSLSRTLESICRKVAKEIVEGKTKKVIINADNLKYYLPQ
ncbi:AAA family ATPase [candidate division WWE3 bacterium]|uniref:AAA family ATPase n=1 Tax=candidate division WWE3 bacterium TaxID=2053526 RepID=A0A7X9E6H8_UNCKA|nr:AAA family ATPase [candidate division WWE3 bacterium]